METVYEVILARESSDPGLKVERQVAVPIIYKGIKTWEREAPAEQQLQVPIIYKGIRFEEGLRAHIFVGKKVLLELKSVERILPAHKKQVQTYLRLTGLKPGYLLNFGEAVLKVGSPAAGMDSGRRESHSGRRNRRYSEWKTPKNPSPRRLGGMNIH